MAVLGVCLLFAIVVGASAVYWLSGQKENIAKDIAEAGEQMANDAEQFAKDKDQQACVDEGIRRMQACGVTGVFCQVKTMQFLEVCLDVAAPDPRMCDDVPASGEIVESIRFELSRCPVYGQPGRRGCNQLYRQLQRWCEDRVAG